MEVNQIYQLVNTTTKETIGDSVLVNEDLSNLVDVGTAIFDGNAVDPYTKALVNQVGKMVFVNRVYRGAAPSVLMDGWEYGSVLEKVASKLPEATVNESWNLVNGQSYDPNIFNGPEVSAKFFNKKVTFEIDRSITEKQLKQSFQTAAQMNAFLSMIYNEIEKSLTVKLDSLIMRTINSMIADTIFSDYAGAALGTTSHIKAVNLLYLYNQKYNTELTAEESITNPDFIRFATYTMGLYKARLSKMSTLFNMGGMERFTPEDALHTVLLAEFAQAAGVYLYDASGQFNTENLILPTAEIVPCWQGTGTDYSFNSTSSINVISGNGNEVVASGILGVMFDRDALGVANIDRRTTTQYVAKAEFVNYFYKYDAGYFNDGNENFVVFFVA